MKKLFHQLLSGALTLALSISLFTPALAADSAVNFSSDVASVTTVEPSAETQDKEILLAQEAFASLSDEAKVLFETALAQDPELEAFHITYVNPDYQSSIAPINSARADAVSTLMGYISRLGLPTSVNYAIRATGVGMVAAVADGPLPIGDILAAAATANLVANCILYWPAVAPQWDDIVYAFRRTFTDSVSNILSAFRTLNDEAVDGYLDSEHDVSINRGGKSITVDGSKYNCRTVAEEGVESLEIDKYYPAVRGDNDLVYVCIASVPFEVAVVILEENSKLGGVFCADQISASVMCTFLGGPVKNSPHIDQGMDNTRGWWYHYHAMSCSNTHIWFNCKSESDLIL